MHGFCKANSKMRSPKIQEKMKRLWDKRRKRKLLRLREWRGRLPFESRPLWPLRYLSVYVLACDWLYHISPANASAIWKKLENVSAVLCFCIFLHIYLFIDTFSYTDSVFYLFPVALPSPAFRCSLFFLIMSNFHSYLMRSFDILQSICYKYYGKSKFYWQSEIFMIELVYSLWIV